MGRKKSHVMRNKRIGRCDATPSTKDAVLAGLTVSNLVDDVSFSSLRPLTAMKQDGTVRNATSFCVACPLPGSLIQNLQRTRMPLGGETQGRRPKIRRSSGDDVGDEAGDYSEDERQEEEKEGEEMVTMSVLELEKWQQRVISHVENYFSNEQLKRIAEFGRVHGTIVQEAKQYVSNIEMQLANQLEKERAALRAQAEEFVAKTAAENEYLRHQVGNLEQQIEGLEKKVETLERQVDVVKPAIEQNHQEQYERQYEDCEAHSPSQNRAQGPYDKRETNKTAVNGLSNDIHDANGNGSGSRGYSSLQPAKQITGELIDPAKPSNSISVCCEEDQLLLRQHQQLQSSCESPTKILC